MSIKTFRTFLILPLSLLLLNAMEEVFVYKLVRLIQNEYLLTGVLLLMFAIGFTLVGSLMAPWAETLLEAGHKKTRKNAGNTGIFIFYGAALLLIYILYFVIYTKGPQYLLPPVWR
jgi:hypothetical protein